MLLVLEDDLHKLVDFRIAIFKITHLFLESKYNLDLDYDNTSDKNLVRLSLFKNVSTIMFEIINPLLM